MWSIWKSKTEGRRWYLLSKTKQILGDYNTLIRHPSPFLNLTSLYEPNTIQELFKLCIYYYSTNPIVSSSLSKIAFYPITDVIYENVDKATEIWYKDLLDSKLSIKSTLMELGLDYFVYGNLFVTVSPAIYRTLECPKGHIIKADTAKNFRFGGKEVSAQCPTCKSVQTMKIHTHTIDDPSKLRIVRWDPSHITIEHSPLTGESWYYYNISNSLKTALRTNPRIFNSAPDPWIQALQNKKSVVMFYENKILHLKRPAPSNHFKGWGYPFIASVMKDLYYVQMLQKAQENVAASLMDLLRIVYPQGQPGVGGAIAQNQNLGHWKSKVTSELTKWRHDPTYIPIMPGPLGYQAIGAEGKSLLLTPEIESAYKSIIAGLQVPQEFVYGGLSWTGSSVSLRMLENDLLNYREIITDMLKKVVAVIGMLASKPIPKVKLKSFKMADDIQRKQTMANLAGPEPVVSKTTLQKEMDLEPDVEKNNMISEARSSQEIMKIQAVAQSSAQMAANQNMVRMQNTKGELPDMYEGVALPYEFVRRANGKLPAANMGTPTDNPEKNPPRKAGGGSM